MCSFARASTNARSASSHRATPRPTAAERPGRAAPGTRLSSASPGEAPASETPAGGAPEGKALAGKAPEGHSAGALTHRVLIVTGGAALLGLAAGLGAGWVAPLWLSIGLGLAGAGAAAGLAWHAGRVVGASAGRAAQEVQAMRAAVERSRSHTRALTRLMNQTSRETDIDTAFRTFLREVREQTQARYAALSIFGEEGAVTKFFTLGMTDAEKERIGRLPEGKGLLGHIHKTQETLRLSDMSAHDASIGFPSGHPPMQSLLAAPITYQEEALGNLYLSDKERPGDASPAEASTAFDAADERFVESAAEAAAVLINEKYARIENRRVRETLREETTAIAAVLERLAEGDLSVDIPEHSSDTHIAELWDGLRATTESLRELLARVQAATGRLSATATQISGTADEMAAGAEEQSAQTEEVASAMEEMSRTIADNAQTTERTSQLAEATEEAARENGQVVRQTVEKMQEIGDVVERSAETVGQLGRSSEEIGEIVATIDEIAGQTNLLALNAAIEAARAGEHGKGFAVVADEVRDLAERTAQATGRVEEMITSLQAEAREAVAAMNEGHGEVQRGIELAGQAGTALDEIMADVKDVAGSIDSIAAATEEQSATGEQIARSVDGISTVTAQTARGVTEIAQSTGELQGLSERLVGAVGQFDLGPAGDGAPRAGEAPRPSATGRAPQLPAAERAPEAR